MPAALCISLLAGACLFVAALMSKPIVVTLPLYAVG